MKIIEIQEVFLISVIPILHLIGFICNIICVKIFYSEKKFKNNIYRYLIAKSIISALVTSILSFAPFTQCFSICERWLNAYFIKFYKKYAAAYLVRSLDMISTLLSVSIVIDRYLCFIGIKFKREKLIFTYLLIAYTCFSFLLFMPNTLFSDIIKQNKTTNYTLDDYTTSRIDIKSNKIEINEVFVYVPTRYLQNNLFRTGVFITQYSISILFFLIVAFFNSILVYGIHKKLKNSNKIVKFTYTARSKSKKRNNLGYTESKKVKSQSAEKNVTKLVCLKSSLFLIHQIAIQIINTALTTMDISSASYNFIVIFYHLFAWMFYGTNIFIFQACNKEFSSKLKKIKFQLLKWT